MGAGRPVFMMTRLENLSAASFTTLRPVRPPQSWHTSVMSLQRGTFHSTLLGFGSIVLDIEVVQQLPEHHAVQLVRVVVRVGVLVRLPEPWHGKTIPFEDHQPTATDR